MVDRSAVGDPHYGRAGMTTHRVRVIARGTGFGEGPVITTKGEIVFVSIDKGIVHRLDAAGAHTALAVVGGGPNGAVGDADDRIYVAQNGGNWMVGRERGDGYEPIPAASGVQVVERDGSFVHLTSEPHAPNDICFGPDGMLYVTDPTRRRTYDDGRIWRVDPSTGVAELLYQLDWFPNGIAFGLEDDAFYVASTGAQEILKLATHPTSPDQRGDVVIRMTFGHPDGMAFDVDGNLLVCALSRTDEPGQIQVWEVTGTLLDHYSPGRHARYTNLALSGDRTIVISDSDGDAMLAIDDWPTVGLALHPLRSASNTSPVLAPALREIDLSDTAATSRT